MNYTRIGLAALGGMVAYFAFGFVAFGALPLLREEFAKYPAVYRSQEGIQSVMPMGMAAMLVAMFVMAVLFAMAFPAGGGVGAGIRFGALVGVFAVCAFVVHNHVNLNIGLTLTVMQAVAYFIEWTLVGVAIGVIYRP